MIFSCEPILVTRSLLSLGANILVQSAVALGIVEFRLTIRLLLLAVRPIRFAADYRPYLVIRHRSVRRRLVRKAELAILQTAVLNHRFRYLVIHLATLVLDLIGTVLLTLPERWVRFLEPVP